MLNWQFVSRAKYRREKSRADAAETRLQTEVMRRNENGADALAAERGASWLKSELATANAKLVVSEGRLAAIITMETPNCASIGKRMARVAREGVE